MRRLGDPALFNEITELGTSISRDMPGLGSFVKEVF
jgi:hypothetical protein